MRLPVAEVADDGTPASSAVISVESARTAAWLARLLRADGREVRDLYFTNDNHLNAYGNRLFARALAESVPWAPREPNG